VGVPPQEAATAYSHQFYLSTSTTYDTPGMDPPYQANVLHPRAFRALLATHGLGLPPIVQHQGERRLTGQSQTITSNQSPPLVSKQEVSNGTRQDPVCVCACQVKEEVQGGTNISPHLLQRHKYQPSPFPKTQISALTEIWAG